MYFRSPTLPQAYALRFFKGSHGVAPLRTVPRKTRSVPTAKDGAILHRVLGLSRASDRIRTKVEDVTPFAYGAVVALNSPDGQAKPVAEALAEGRIKR